MDSNAIMWDIPTQRTRKTEKYDFPVLTMSAIELKGSNRKFSLNKSAMETLDLIGGESQVNIGFKGNDVFIAKGSKFNIGKNCSFSDKKVFEYLVKLWNLNTTIENEFSILKVADNLYEIVTLGDALEIQQLGGATLEQEDFTTNISNEDLELTGEMTEETNIPAILRESAKVLQESDNITNIEEIVKADWRRPQQMLDSNFDKLDDIIDFKEVGGAVNSSVSDSDWE